jgi:hypothetical protein
MNSDWTDITQAAVALRASHPMAPALDVLDLVMQRPADAEPGIPGVSREELAATRPDSPFGKLLREAFAPAFTDAELASRWQSAVLEAFARRYGLPFGDDAPWREACRAQLLRRWPHLPAESVGELACVFAELPEWRSLEPAAAADLFVRTSEERDSVQRKHTAFELALVAEGAAQEAIEDGLRAAMSVFTNAGMSPAQAMRGRSIFDESKSVSCPTDQIRYADISAARTWNEAEAAAVSACGGTAAPSQRVRLELRWRDEALGQCESAGGDRSVSPSEAGRID